MDSKSGMASAKRKYEKRKRSRAKLLEAAFQVFVKRGYEGASLERVADVLGFSKGAVYSNFASKDELFFELVASRIDQGIETVRSATESRTTRSQSEKRASVAHAIGRELRAFNETDMAWQLLFLEFCLRCARNTKLRAQLAERRREMRGKIAVFIVARAKAVGAQVGRMEAMDLATTVLALSNGFGIEGIIDPKAAPPRLLGELLSRIIDSSSFARGKTPPKQRPSRSRRSKSSTHTEAR